MTNLTDRLDHFAGCLDQEGREAEAALVREAVEELAAKAKPAIVGTPWTTPLKGDKCTRVDGKSRLVTAVSYTRGLWNKNEKRETPAPGYWPDYVAYLDDKDVERSVSASSWAAWCRAACKPGAGGTYERAPEAS